MKLALSLCILMFVCTISLSAQTVTGSGNTGYLSKFSGTSVVTSSLIYDNGTKVGIGTTTPSVQLEVANAYNAFKFDPSSATMTIMGYSYYGILSPRLRFSLNGDVNPLLNIVTHSHDNLAVAFDAYNDGYNWISSHASSNFSLNKFNNEFIIGYNSGTAPGSTFNGFNLTNGVRFGNNGNMGIGVAAGTAKLEINAGAGNENIRISSAEGVNSRYLSSLNFDNPALSYHAWKDNVMQRATSEISFLDRPGTSGYPNTVRTSDILLKTAHNWNGIQYGQYLDTTVAIRSTQDGGYMGIGITIPQAKLDVNGTIFCRQYLYVGTPDPNTVTQMSNYKLAVNGTAIFNRAVVKLYGNWPDYVFEDSYKLLPIADLQKYVEVNKHLPEMTSAKEIEKDGIDIGSQQILLLKKVEELTLYIIDLNKKVDAISKENKSLKKNTNSKKL